MECLNTIWSGDKNCKTIILVLNTSSLACSFRISAGLSWFASDTTFWQCSGHEEHAWNQVFQNVNVLADTMVILTFFGNILVMMMNISLVGFFYYWLKWWNLLSCSGKVQKFWSLKAIKATRPKKAKKVKKINMAQNA